MKRTSTENTLKTHIGYWLNRLRSHVHSSFNERLTKHELSVAAWCILVAIYDNKATSINELAHYIEVDKASISRVVEKLVAKQLLSHSQGKDRRSGKITLTEKAKKLVPKLMSEAEENEQHFFGHLSSTEKETLREIMNKVLRSISGVTVEGWLSNKLKLSRRGKNTMSTEAIEKILTESKINKWPYPKTFEALKDASVDSYSVSFENGFQAIYRGGFGSLQEKEPAGYRPVKAAKDFDAENIKNAIIKHVQQQTPFVEFLADIASFGVSHYIVDMKQRTVTYFNPDESQSHVEHVPLWNQ